MPPVIRPWRAWIIRSRNSASIQTESAAALSLSARCDFASSAGIRRNDARIGTPLEVTPLVLAPLKSMLFGKAKFSRFKKLKNSARNCTLNFSEIFVSFTIEISALKKRGAAKSRRQDFSSRVRCKPRW